MKFVRLIPKTRKGTNRITEAKTDIWLIRQETSSVGFSSVISDWFLIEPTQLGPRGKQELWRWIDSRSDPDFTLVFVNDKRLPVGLQ
jgi:hypothetical protein